jgi:hypothetical protein
MRITWSTVLCTAAVFVLLLSGDEPGDGTPSGPHLSNSAVTEDLRTSMESAPLTHRSNTIASVAIAAVSEDGKSLSPDCFASYAPSVPAAAGNYAAAVRSLVRHGWHEFRVSTSAGFRNTELSKGGWTLAVAEPVRTPASFVAMIDLFATDTTC